MYFAAVLILAISSVSSATAIARADSLYRRDNYTSTCGDGLMPLCCSTTSPNITLALAETLITVADAVLQANPGNIGFQCTSFSGTSCPAAQSQTACCPDGGSIGTEISIGCVGVNSTDASTCGTASSLSCCTDIRPPGSGNSLALFLAGIEVQLSTEQGDVGLDCTAPSNDGSCLASTGQGVCCQWAIENGKLAYGCNPVSSTTMTPSVTTAPSNLVVSTGLVSWN